MELITQNQAAALRGVTRQAINKLIQRGRLKSYDKKLSLRQVLGLKPDKPGRKPKVNGAK